MGVPRAAAVTVALVLGAGGAAAEERPLFLPHGFSADISQPGQLGVVRERLVDVDLSSLDALARVGAAPSKPTIVLNLFDDVVLHAQGLREESLDRGRSWVGRLEGEPLSAVVLVFYEGVLSGSVVWPGGAYRVGFDPRGSHVVQELDHGQFPENNCYREAPPGSEAEPAPASDGPLAVGDDGSLIEVLVAYTPAARTAAGGTAAMASLINTAITETNTGYSNSGVIQRVHLAGTAEVSYTEATIGTDLTRLTGTSDGFMDSVHALRDSKYADLVVLIGEGYAYAEGACGIAWLTQANSSSYASQAFSVVDRTCTTGYYSFGHEMGHNMGLNHARVDPVGTGAYSYSYGYKDPGNAFRTVMAYNCPVSCTRILYFSNPTVSYTGKPTGIVETSPSSAYNALSLNNTRVTVANWRVTPTPVRAGTFYLRNSNSAGWPDISLSYGTEGDIPVVGDWNGDGMATIGIFRPSHGAFYLRNSNTPGSPDVAVFYGSPGDIPVVGDWNGDGTDTIGIFRPSQGAFYLRNSNTPGSPDVTVYYGSPGDVPLVGDWNGDGTDTIGIFRPSLAAFYLRNANTGGYPDIAVSYGTASDVPVAGDWNGDGTVTIGIFRPSHGAFYLRNTNTPGSPDIPVSYGSPGDVPLLGDWNGDNIDTIGIFRLI